MSFKLPVSAKLRKMFPVYSGVLKYFPLALAAVSYVSKLGNDQHNPGGPLYWNRGLSADQLDAAVRHTLDVAIGDLDGELSVYEQAQVAWRELAELQLRIERAGGLAAALGLKDEP